MSASQNIVENDILDLPDEECSLVNTSEINRKYTISSLPDCAEISNISGISRVACSSSITGKKNNLLQIKNTKYYTIVQTLVIALSVLKHCNLQ